MSFTVIIQYQNGVKKVNLLHMDSPQTINKNR